MIRLIPKHYTRRDLVIDLVTIVWAGAAVGYCLSLIGSI